MRFGLVKESLLLRIVYNMDNLEVNSLVYITECLLATVEETFLFKKYSKEDKSRHRSIAIHALDLCLRCNVTAELAESLGNTRVSEVIKGGFESWYNIQ